MCTYTCTYVYFSHQIHQKYSPNMDNSWNKITDLWAQSHMLDAEVSHTAPAISWKQNTQVDTQSSLFFYLIQIASVFKLFNLLLKFEAAAYILLWCEIRHNTSKWRCVIISEARFSFCRLYIIPAFSTISILVDIGEVRGNVYFSDWANQNHFSSKHWGSEKASQPPVQRRPGTRQSWGSAGVLGGSSRVCLCLWAQESQVFASHLLQALWSKLVEKVQEIGWAGWNCSCRAAILLFSIAWSHI